MTKQEFINKYIYGTNNDALTDNQEAIDMSNDLDKYVAEQLRQYNVVRQSEQKDLDCPFDFTSRCTLGRCSCKPKAN